MNNNLKTGYKREASPATKRYCQFLKLNKETPDEYKYWHNSKNIWKEIPQGIRHAGILDMEIYVIDDLAFMIVETPPDFNWDEAFGRLATSERQAEWEDFVSKYQVVEKGQTSDRKWKLIERIFSLEEAIDSYQ
jgi:L-rhamnose mutarotase